MCLKFGFVIFWQKDFGAKATHKMLVKLTLVYFLLAKKGAQPLGGRIVILTKYRLNCFPIKNTLAYSAKASFNQTYRTACGALL